MTMKYKRWLKTLSNKLSIRHQILMNQFLKNSSKIKKFVTKYLQGYKIGLIQVFNN